MAALLLALLTSAQAGAAELTLEVRIAPLDPHPAQPRPASWEPLWEIPPDRGAVFPWFPAEQLLAVARFLGPPPAPADVEISTVWRLDPPAVDGRPVVLPAGVPLVLENPGQAELVLRVEGLAEPLAVPAGGRAELPESVWGAPGWHALSAVGDAAEWRALLVEPPFAAGWARLAGPGRLVIDFGNVVAEGSEPVVVHLELWMAEQPVCPVGSQPGCRIERTGTSQDGRIALQPVVISAAPREGTGGAGEP